MAIKKTGLGRGLDALFPEKAPEKKAPVKSTAKSAEVKKEKPSAAESLGGVETLITYPTTQTHADVPKEIRERNGITESTLRLSVGIEDVQDLLDEFEKVFAETEEELYGRKKS